MPDFYTWRTVNGEKMFTFDFTARELLLVGFCLLAGIAGLIYL